MKQVSATLKPRDDGREISREKRFSNRAFEPVNTQDHHGLFMRLPGPVLHIHQDGTMKGLTESGDRQAHILASPENIQSAEKIRELAIEATATNEVKTKSFAWLERGQTRWLEVDIVPNEGDGAIAIGRDTTLDVNMRLALVDSRQRYKDLVEISSDFAWETDLSGAFTFVSPTGALGYSAEALVGTMAQELLYHRSSKPDHLAFEAQDPVGEMELWLKSSYGSAVCVLTSAKPTLSRSGKRTGARGICRDITIERLRENDLTRLKVREQVIAYLVDAVRNEARPMGMLSTAVTSISGAMTDTACAVFQRDGANSLNLVAHHGSLPDSGTMSNAIERARTETTPHEERIDDRSVLMMATHYRNDMNGAILLSRETLAEWSDHERSLLEAVAGQLGIALRQIRDQSELERLSRTDALTGLYNRRAFLEELERAIQRSRRHGFQSAVFFADLNNFKAVNDTHGHDVGDRVLKRLSNILRDAARSYDFVARLGGDEFALWFENINKETARRRANEILRSCRDLEEFSGSSEKCLGLSIGIAMDQPNSQESSDCLLKRADAAMYRAKHSRKHNISLARNRQFGVS